MPLDSLTSTTQLDIDGTMEHHRLETWWYIMLCPQYVRYRRCRNLPEVEITRRRYLRGHAGFRYPRRIQRFAPSCRQYLTALWKLERSEEHTSELQSRFDLVCRLL